MSMVALYAAQAAREAEHPDAGQAVPPDPTKYDLTWGKEYPCLRMKQNASGGGRYQCPGKMQPAKRCFRYEGVLWRRFKCDRCDREATDLKDQASSSPGATVK